MTSTGSLWNWTSPAWLIAVALVIAYGLALQRIGLQRIGLQRIGLQRIGLRRSWPRRSLAWAIGLTLWVLAFVSPIGTLADGYLFSAHMVQHLLLLLAIPLCLLLALPPLELSSVGERRNLDRRKIFSALEWNGIPMVGWILGVGAMWFWHVPTLCNASIQNDSLGVMRDGSLIAAGLAFWWPIYAPVHRYRLKPLDGICYLFSACLGCTLLGIYITFTTISVCPAFANPVERIGVVSRLYDAGLTPSVDQNLGGLLMWVPPCTLYVCAIVSLLCRWYCDVEPLSETGAPAPNTKQRGYAS